MEERKEEQDTVWTWKIVPIGYFIQAKIDGDIKKNEEGKLERTKAVKVTRFQRYEHGSFTNTKVHYLQAEIQAYFLLKNEQGVYDPSAPLPGSSLAPSASAKKKGR